MTQFAPRIVEKPTVKMLTVAQAKAHLNVLESDDDPLIEGFIDAAIGVLDGYSGILGRCLITQKWQQAFDEFAFDLRLPFPDVKSVVVIYSDTDDAEIEVTEGFELLEDTQGSFLRFSSSFSPPSLNRDRSDRVRVDLVAGYGALATDVPNPIVTAAALMIAHWYENREAASANGFSALPFSADFLLQPYRRALV